ncbi:hypothetical protein NL676_038655 [Syzygium grande]|nr:hypothetical protein NL676_038655 [Syzygium grande]
MNAKAKVPASLDNELFYFPVAVEGSTVEAICSSKGRYQRKESLVKPWEANKPNVSGFPESINQGSPLDREKFLNTLRKGHSSKQGGGGRTLKFVPSIAPSSVSKRGSMKLTERVPFL